jgi:hypothetical protein
MPAWRMAWAAAALLAAVLAQPAAAQPAAAQPEAPPPEPERPPVSRPLDAAAAARGVSVMTRPRPLFDPPGLRLGAFRLDTVAELGLGYDDNLLGTRPASRSSAFSEFGLNGVLRSQWSRHELRFEAGLTDRRFFSAEALDWRDWLLDAYGRLDVADGAALDARVSRRRGHFGVQSLDAALLPLLQPAVYDEDRVRIGGRMRFNRIGLDGHGQYRQVRFRPDATQPSALTSDYDAWGGAVGLSYLLSPGRSLRLDLTAEETSGRDSAFTDLDALTWEALVGGVYDFDGVYQVSFGVGYARRDFREGGLEPVSGLGIDLRLTYAPSLLTTVNLRARRGVDDSVRALGPGFLRSLATVRVDHEFRQDLIGSVELGYDMREYSNPSRRASDVLATVSAQLLLNRSTSLVASYRHVTRLTSTPELQEYAQNEVLLRLRLAY